MIRRKFKLLTSVFLVIVMVFSMVLPAHAAVVGNGYEFNEENSHLTITNNDGFKAIKSYTIEMENIDVENIENITIGKDVTSIGDEVFEGCDSLTQITIGEGVINIADDAFFGCDNLTAIKVDVANQFYKSTEDGVLFSKDGRKLIKYPAKKEGTHYEISEGVKNIGAYAFKDCRDLTQITIPEGAESIGDDAFYGCTGLKEITIPNTAINIGDDAFIWCKSLTAIIVDRGNANYSSDDGVLFSKDGTKLIKYPEGKEGNSYKIPEGVKSIGDYAFYGRSGLTEIIIPNTVTSIGDFAFLGYTDLTRINIPDSVKNIGAYAFKDCRDLTQITIPEGVESIGNYAFYRCRKLGKITIPNTVISIGYNAFLGRESLTAIIVDGANTNYSSSIDGVLFSKDGTKLIKYPEGKEGNSYKVPEGVESIDSWAFYGCSELDQVTISNTVKSIGDDAFFKCAGLTIALPESVQIDSSVLKCVNVHIKKSIQNLK